MPTSGNISARVRIGELDDEIVIQRATLAANDYGDPVPTWSTLVSTWAKVEWLEPGSDEMYRAGIENEYNRVDFTIRYNSDVRSKDRISFGGNYFDIQTVHYIGRQQFTKLQTVLRQ